MAVAFACLSAHAFVRRRARSLAMTQFRAPLSGQTRKHTPSNDNSQQAAPSARVCVFSVGCRCCSHFLQHLDSKQLLYTKLAWLPVHCNEVWAKQFDSNAKKVEYLIYVALLSIVAALNIIRI